MTITVSLSAASFADAAKQLRNYAKSLDSKTEKLVREIGERGAELATLHFLEDKHVETGETLNSIHYDHDGNSGTVSVGGNAVWIEFGTGVKRNGGSAGVYVHEKAAELGMSPIGCYEKGHGADPNGWWYYDASGKKHHTFGIASNPFMYKASQGIRSELYAKAKEVFKTL